MQGIPRLRWAVALALLGLLLGVGDAAAQTPTSTADGTTFDLKPTEQCPPTDIDRLQRVIRFVRSQSWAENPGSNSFSLSPDTNGCRVVMKINQISRSEEAALERGGEGRLAIERARDNAEPSRLPLLLWVVFGGAGLVFVFARYGRR